MPENIEMTFSSVFLDKIPPVDAHIDEMMQWGKKLSENGFVRRAEDNFSFRTKMGFIITGSGISLGNVTNNMVVDVRGVVFGLNRPSVYVKGQATPSKDALLHSCIYEAFPEINAIICVHGQDIIAAAVKNGLPATDVEQPGGSHELAQESVNMLTEHRSVRCFILKNYGVLALGATMADTGKLIEAIHAGSKKSPPSKTAKRRMSK